MASLICQLICADRPRNSTQRSKMGPGKHGVQVQEQLSFVYFRDHKVLLHSMLAAKQVSTLP